LKKIIHVLIIGILFFSGLGAAVTGFSQNEYAKKVDKISVEFQPIVIKEYSNEYLEIKFKEDTTYFFDPGKPVIPKIIKIIELPFGVEIIDINFEPNKMLPTLPGYHFFATIFGLIFSCSKTGIRTFSFLISPVR